MVFGRRTPKKPALAIGVVLPTWVGDACMATPTVRAIRIAYPNASIVGVMRPLIRELLDGGWGDKPPWFDDYEVFSKKASTGAPSRLGLISQLRKRRLDVVVLLTNSLWSAVVARLAGARRIVGYNRDARGWFLSDRLAVPLKGKGLAPISPIDYYLALAAWLGCETPGRAMTLHTTSQERQLANAFWNKAQWSDSLPTVAINSGAATAATRIWPIGQVKSLALRIATELNWQVVLHCGPAERAATNQIASEANDTRVASLGIMDDLPIGLSKSVLERAACVVSTDSGPRHMSIALQRPVVTLFGPTDAAWTKTYNIPEIEISEALPCRACYQSPCPLKHHRCMEDISVDRVLSAVKMSVASRMSI